jgi:hypothetical protein
MMDVFVKDSKLVEAEQKGKHCEAPDVSAALGWAGLCRILHTAQDLVIGFSYSKPFHICSKQRRPAIAKYKVEKPQSPAYSSWVLTTIFFPIFPPSMS